MKNSIMSLNKLLFKIRVSLFDRYGWFYKEMTSEFCNRGHFNYLVHHPQYINGKVGVSKHIKGVAFWNTTGKEHAPMFPTIYFPIEWVEDLNKRYKQYAHARYEEKYGLD